MLHDGHDKAMAHQVCAQHAVGSTVHARVMGAQDHRLAVWGGIDRGGTLLDVGHCPPLAGPPGHGNACMLEKALHC